jgi:uncharacterized repeat protein (TIGR01451 family)
MEKKRMLALILVSVLMVTALPVAASTPAATDRLVSAPTVPNTLDPAAAWDSDMVGRTQSVAWGDWDNDGDLDLAVANDGYSNYLYENAGTWLQETRAWSSDEQDRTLSLAWGDWDNDGDLDLAAGNFGEANRVYANEGGALTLAWSSAETDDTRSVAWGDWDNDGDLDLAVGNDNQPNRVYENEGGLLVLAWFSGANDPTTAVAWADHDGDGFLDLAVANNGEPNQVFWSDGFGLYLTWSSTEVDASHDVAWGDWNGDGLLDLAIANEDEFNRVYQNDGSSFSLAWSSDEQNDTRGVAWGDWDGDGDLDLAVANNTQSNRVYLNAENDLTLVWSCTEEDPSYVVAWGDWNNDGDLDLAVGNGSYLSGPPNRVYENVAGPMAPSAYWSSTEEDVTQDVAWGDWDGDGDLDLAVANNGQANHIYQNDAGQLAVAWSSPETAASSAVAWGDWDGDDDLDLAVANSSASSNLLYQNDAGSMNLIWSSPETEDSTSVAWGDWDGDGDLDLAVGNQMAANRVYLNAGMTLTLAWSSPEDDTSKDVAWGDWDNDGDLDLAVANDSQPNRVYQNDGLTLTLAWSSIETDRSTSVAWGDWDGDGDLDLAVGNYFDEVNRVYENDGGTLALSWSSNEADDSNDIAWGDWDGDGDLDLAAANWQQPSRVYENLGPGLDTVSFWSTEENEDNNAVAWGDYDDDGDLDLMVGNGGAQFNRLYRSNRISFPALPNTAPYPVVYRPGTSADADFYATAEVLTAGQIPIWYRLYDAEGDLVTRVVARYSTNGGGNWSAATVSGATTNLSASPTGELHGLTWNAFADGVSGDNIRFRIISVIDVPLHAGQPVQRPYVSAETLAFRVRPLAVNLLPPRQLGIGSAGQVLTHTLTLSNRTGRDAVFALNYDSFRGWPVDGPSLAAVASAGSTSFVVSTTIPAGPPQVLDVVTATASALFNPSAFRGQAYILTFRGAPSVTLSVDKDAPATVAAGTVMTYTLVAHNAGASPASGVTVADVLPAEVAFAWASDEGIYSPTLGAVLWPEMVLMSEQSMTVTVAVTAGCSPSGTAILNDDYSVDCAQCAEPIAGLSVTTTVLYEAPAAAFSLGTMTVTVGVPLTLTNHSTDAAAYLWSFGDGSTSGLFEPQHTYTAAGSYTVTLTASNLCGSDQATAMVSVVVPVTEYRIHLPVVMKGYTP